MAKRLKITSPITDGNHNQFSLNLPDTSELTADSTLLDTNSNQEITGSKYFNNAELAINYREASGEDDEFTTTTLNGYSIIIDQANSSPEKSAEITPEYVEILSGGASGHCHSSLTAESLSLRSDNGASGSGPVYRTTYAHNSIQFNPDYQPPGQEGGSPTYTYTFPEANGYFILSDANNVISVDGSLTFDCYLDAETGDLHYGGLYFGSGYGGASLNTVGPYDNESFAINTTETNDNIKLLTGTGKAYYNEYEVATKHDIEELPEPMIFKGTVGDPESQATISDLPPATIGNLGWVYKCISNGTYYPSIVLHEGDTVVCAKTSDSPETYEWVVIPSGDEPRGTVTSVGLSMPTGFTVTNSPVTSSGILTAVFASGYELLNSNSEQIIYGEKSFGGTAKFGTYNAGTSGFLSEGSISSTSLSSLNLSADHQLVLSANGYGLASSGFSFKDIYKSGSTTYTSTYSFPNRKTENKSYIIATTDDIPAVSLITTAGSEAITVDSNTLNVVTRNTNQTIAGTKIFQDWVTIESQYVSYPKLRLENEKIIIWPTSTGYWAGFGYDSNSTQPTIFINNDTSEGGYQITIPYKNGIIATTDDIPANIKDGTGTNAIYQAFDTNYGNTIDMSAKNPNAWELYQAAGHSGDDKYITKGATGQYATSLGGISAAAGKRALADGTNTIAIGKYSHAEGDNSVTLGNESHAEGYQTVTNGDASHAEGVRTQAIGNNSHAEGAETISKGENSHAEGYNSIVGAGYIIVNHDAPTPTPGPEPEPGPTPTPAELDALNGDGAHAEGHNNFVLGCGAHVEGDLNRAYGRLSHAEGHRTQTGELILRKTEDNKDYYTPDQDKQFQHAEGENTKAIGHASHAGGYETIAGYDYQTVIGKYNANKEHTLFEVGYGWADGERHNALEVYDDGHVVIGSYVEVGGMGINAGTNVLATKGYVDAHTFPACTKTTAGNYILQAKVASDGTVTYDWILDNFVRLS